MSEEPGGFSVLDIDRVLRRERRGSSSPVIVSTSDGPFVVKLRGAAQGTSALVAELIVGALARRLALPVPEMSLMRLAGDTPSDDIDSELTDLLGRSRGINLGFRFVPGARVAGSPDLAEAPLDFAAQVRWLDWLVQNTDRGPKNPNLLRVGEAWWLIDHGAALPFQHDWSRVTEESAQRRGPSLPHVFDARAADRIADWDPVLTAILSREVLQAAVDGVPDAFLEPLLPQRADQDLLRRRRAAYVAYLWKRLRGPRDFSAAAG